jgi:hypothetical protein
MSVTVLDTARIGAGIRIVGIASILVIPARRRISLLLVIRTGRKLLRRRLTKVGPPPTILSESLVATVEVDLVAPREEVLVA